MKAYIFDAAAHLNARHASESDVQIPMLAVTEQDISAEPETIARALSTPDNPVQRICAVPVEIEGHVFYADADGATKDLEARVVPIDLARLRTSFGRRVVVFATDPEGNETDVKITPADILGVLDSATREHHEHLLRVGAYSADDEHR
ncbi:hypothetical protein [Tranquillimonas alkanivorans]|uniref:Uncharacterized protein n=1 Tax=Tranquillimonas alkanivorans TaxID=441119 RepID=A0A1I5TUJ8_9RHOB|nr:hypothetical protein [Tranquillimonas alkanivorans]SFP86277.1 hypothetical protein SAMN04488047_11516 [Tranquillimonas alkanivorans]